ncbi:MAG TPA: hypothetical protein EYP53_09720 [Candidatus Latescibacteria bacterium]|nr:hypothetical protein [Candidatus Latescibacterota bacterium]
MKDERQGLKGGRDLEKGERRWGRGETSGNSYPTINRHPFSAIRRQWRKVFKAVKNWLIYRLVVILIRIIRSLSRAKALKFGAGLGLLAYWTMPRQRRQTIDNLRAAFGTGNDHQIKRLSKEAFFDLGANAVDAVRLEAMSKEQVLDIVKAEGLEHLDAALEAGKGVIVVSGHIGNWELLAAYIAARGYPLNVVARELYDPRLNRILVSTRERFGTKNLTRGKDTRRIVRALKRGEIVAFLIDQDTKVDGIFVDFFGRPAHTPVGPVVLAMKTGAPLLPIAIHREEDGLHHVVVRRCIQVGTTGTRTEKIRNSTARCSRLLEEFISQHPTQWVWMHQRWKTRPKEGARET